MDEEQDKTTIPPAEAGVTMPPVEAAPAHKNDLVGRTLSGKYQVLQLVGRGGMSSVYKGKHLILGKIYAIKVMHGHLVADSNALIRFKQEAAAASALSHENIITVHDFDSEDGQPYQAIDYLEGSSLSEEIASKGKIEPERALHIFIQAASALAHAHSKGIIHRDLKPSNIMLVEQDGDKDFVKLVDFGIAKLLPQEGEAVQRLTQTGEVFGSPLYMSPEQCLGQKLDSRSDIYSMGCLMYETLTGKAPHAGNTVFETIQKHIDETPKPIKEHVQSSKLIERLEPIILKSLAKQPAQRQQSMDELLQELQAIESGEHSNPIKALGRNLHLLAIRLEPLRKRTPMKLVLAVCVISLAVAASATWLTQLLIEPIPAYANMDWPQFTLEENMFLEKNNETLRNVTMIFDQFISRVGNLHGTPLQNAKYYLSLSKGFATNGNYHYAELAAVKLRDALDQCTQAERHNIAALLGPTVTRPDAVQYICFIADACYAKKNYQVAAYFYNLARAQLGEQSTYTRKRVAMKLADAYLMSDSPVEALKEFLACADSHDGHFSADLFDISKDDPFEPDQATFLSKIADLLARNNLLKESAKAYQVAAEQWEKDEESLAYAGQAYYKLGLLREKMNDWQAASEAFSKSQDAFSRAHGAASRTNLPAVLQEKANVLYKNKAYLDAFSATIDAHTMARNLAKK